MTTGWDLAIQAVIAVATVLAVFMAWSSARSSTVAAEAASNAIKFEQQRARDRETAELLEQPRQVLVDLVSDDVADANGLVALDCWCRITNGSSKPIKRVRVRIGTSDVCWGPQLLGHLAPGKTRTIVARIYLQEAPAQTLDAAARFVDAREEAWIATARGQLTHDEPDGVDHWIKESERFALSRATLSDAERGLVLEMDFQHDIEDFRSASGVTNTIGPRERFWLSNRADEDDSQER